MRDCDAISQKQVEAVLRRKGLDPENPPPGAVEDAVAEIMQFQRVMEVVAEILAGMGVGGGRGN